MAPTVIPEANLVREGREAARGRIGRLEKSITALNSSLDTAETRRAELATERKAVAFAARAQNDAAALKRRDAIDQELARLERDISDDRAAIAELTTQLGAARNAVALAEWEQRRAKARELVRSRLEGGSYKKIEAAVSALVDAVRETAREEDALSDALREFEPNRRMTHSVDGYCGKIIAARLQEFVPVMLFGKECLLGDRSILKHLESGYRSLLESLDNCEPRS